VRYPAAPVLYSSLIDVVLSEPSASNTCDMVWADVSELVDYHLLGLYNGCVTDEQWEAPGMDAKATEVAKDVVTWDWPPGREWIGGFLAKARREATGRPRDSRAGVCS
jgi:hypothetical protein